MKMLLETRVENTVLKARRGRRREFETSFKNPIICLVNS